MKQKLIAIIVILIISVYPVYHTLANNAFLIIILLLIAMTAVLIAFADPKQTNATSIKERNGGKDHKQI